MSEEASKHSRENTSLARRNLNPSLAMISYGI
jgi:hypothetical protein